MTPSHHATHRATHDGAVLAPFAAAHLEGALRLSQEMGWPYSLEDWRLALELGEGFVLLQDGAVIGTAAWWAYGARHASAGMVIVSKAAQGRGLGARLMDALMAAADSRSITLNSTAEGLRLYERRGFVRTGRIIQQHQGIPVGDTAPPPPERVRRALASDLAAIAALDHAATGWHRPDMLARLLRVADGYLLMQGGQACGYALCRPFGRGHVIGPVVAEQAAGAQALIEAALARLGRVFVRVDTPADLPLGGWLAALGLPPVDAAITMARGDAAPVPGPVRMFALANQSFN